ncbi:MAG: hypothetical protein PHE02_02760 [Lachnospiraceae bacterium]|nr:hypothetical protein [Lachnospiraceae bacterium]
MNFLELRDQFIIDKPDYTNDVNNFLNYIQKIRKLNIQEQEDFFVSGMSTEQVIQSLKYFVDKGQIKKQEPARKYFVSIGQFFEYILNNSKYKNENFFQELANPSSRENSYSRKTADFVSDYNKLQPKETLDKFDTHLIDDLINWCDEILNKADFTNRMTNTNFKRVNAALGMKLILLTGVTYRETRKILYRDLNSDNNTIFINDFRIRLPLKLSVQFQGYKKYRELFLTSDYLFVNIDGEQWGDATSDSGIPNFLNTAIGQTNVTGLIKFGITQLIQSGVNDSVIMKLTGASREILNSCLSNEDNNTFWEQYINSKLVTTEKYYSL